MLDDAHVFPKDLSIVLDIQEISEYPQKTTEGKVSINSHICTDKCLVVSGSSWKMFAYFCDVSYAFWEGVVCSWNVGLPFSNRILFLLFKKDRWQIHVSMGTSEFFGSLVAKLILKNIYIGLMGSTGLLSAEETIFYSVKTHLWITWAILSPFVTLWTFFPNANSNTFDVK